MNLILMLTELDFSEKIHKNFSEFDQKIVFFLENTIFG
jgi:hypothetical protein